LLKTKKLSKNFWPLFPQTQKPGVFFQALISARSAQEEIDCYNVLFADAGRNTAWFTRFSSFDKPESMMEFLHHREKLGYYTLHTVIAP